jgi:phospholipid/cholesterol/gamma-HCH transport system substrate-binding protein
VKRAIIVHRSDFIAITMLFALAIVVVGYVLEHQPAFTLGQSYYTVYADFQTGAAVTAGQGQSVDIAGVEVGLVGGIKLQHGVAVVQMNIFKKYAPIYRNATVLLRPRTPLKDMYLSLDPGSPSAGRLPSGATLGTASTDPDIDVDQILGSLDADSRTYLLLLLAGGAQIFRNGSYSGEVPSVGAVASLQGLFKRFAPLNRDTESFTRLLAQRNDDIRNSIHNLDQVVTDVGDVDTELTSLIKASNTNFQAISSQDANLQAGLTLLPGALQQTATTLGDVRAFAAQSAPALQKSLPFARELAPALAAAQPLFRDTRAAIKDQLRPFSVAVQPLARLLRPAAAKLARATPNLVSSLNVLNDLFNTLAYKSKGPAESYLFWGSWLAHIGASLTDTQDAQGAIVRGVFIATCPELDLFEVALTQSDPALGPLVDLLNAPPYNQIDSKFCPASLP